MQSRSTNAEDFQHLPHNFAVMVKHYASKFIIDDHSHERHQLLYATSGLMQLYIDNEIWLVPNDRAIFIPAGMVHSIKMLSDVVMRTLYIDVNSGSKSSKTLKAISVKPLMRELITALGEEKINYQHDSRAEKIAQLIELELQFAKNVPLIIPLPQDPRLQQVCAALMKNPADNKTLYQWGVKYGGSERTFSRLFNNELGLSFRRWRQLVRFHYAFELLAKNKSIKHVATACGYLSPSAFTAAFQQYSGHTPSNINF
jgi:AraC-like DNA-binding protein/quercetin dioxygenase-like cupin family protein